MQTVISELVLNLCNINITFYVFIWRQYCVLLCGCLVYNELQILLSIVGTISKWICPILDFMHLLYVSTSCFEAAYV